jgi:MFS superfamily sulfate permease-like transporter/CRP-like cAMP-binding protein
MQTVTNVKTLDPISTPSPFADTRQALSNTGQTKQFWLDELKGGIAGAVSSLPQSIAYGVIAFSPLGADFAVWGALAGIYSSIIAGLTSCLAGSAPIMISGSRGATAVIFAALLTQILNYKVIDTHTLLALAFLAVFLSGFIQVILGLLKVGYLVKFVPQTVIAGFLNGSGLLILAGQIPALTGFSLTQLGAQLLSNWHDVAWGSLMLGLSTALVMELIPRFWKNAPAGLLAIIVGCASYHLLHRLFGNQLMMGEVFPQVASALPNPQTLSEVFRLITAGEFKTYLPVLLPAALSIALISSLDSLLSAAALDNLTLGRTNGNRELLGQGLGNICASLFGAIPSSGSMGRSGALYQAGGRSRWSVIFNIGVLSLLLVGLGPVFSYIPKAVVAGVLIIIGLQLFDKRSVNLLLTLQSHQHWVDYRADLLVIASVVAATLIWNLITAVGIGIVLTVILFVRRMSGSIVRRRYRGNHVHSRQIRGEYSAMQLECYGHRIVVLELEGAIFFGSADSLEMEVERLAASGAEYFILDMKRVNDIDSSGAFVLQRIYQRLKLAGKFLVISYIDKERRQPTMHSPEQVIIKERRSFNQDRRLWRTLWAFGLIKKLGEDAFVSDTDAALGVCELQLLINLMDKTQSFDDVDMLRAGIFSSLTESEFAWIKPWLKLHKYTKNTVVFRQGDQGDALYILLKGIGDVMIDIPGGRQKRVQTLLPGALFGEMALMDGEPRAAHVIMIEDSECLRFAKEDFEMLMAETPAIALKIYAKIGITFAKRLRAANLMIMELEA